VTRLAIAKRKKRRHDVIVVRRALHAKGVMLNESADSLLTSSRASASPVHRSRAHQLTGAPAHGLTGSQLTVFTIIFIFFPHARTRGRRWARSARGAKIGRRVVERRWRPPLHGVDTEQTHADHHQHLLSYLREAASGRASSPGGPALSPMRGAARRASASRWC
jgi:hypothetical protein